MSPSLSPHEVAYLSCRLGSRSGCGKVENFHSRSLQPGSVAFGVAYLVQRSLPRDRVAAGQFATAADNRSKDLPHILDVIQTGALVRQEAPRSHLTNPLITFVKGDTTLTVGMNINLEIMGEEPAKGCDILKTL